MDDLYKVLNLDSPFRWRPVMKEENRHEFDFEQETDNTFSFLNFCARIVLVYDAFLNNGLPKAVQILDDVEKKLVNLDKCEDELYKTCRDAFHHVLYACKALLAIDSGKNDSEVSQWVETINPVDKLNDASKAALLAIKATSHAVFNYENLETSLSQINMALAVDQTTSFWPFLKGVFLQKQRPFGEVPSLLEREMFELAVKRDNNNPLFMVYLADTLRDMCKYHTTRQNSYLWFVAKSVQINAETEIKKKFETALDLYRKSYKLKPECPVIAFKCAHGLMRLPPKYQDTKLIKEIVTACDGKFQDSGFGNLVLTLYHEKISKKNNLVRHHLTRCWELNFFYGCINLVRVEFRENKENSKVVERLEKMLDMFQESFKQEIIISQIISYCVFVSGDFEKACEYMLKYYKKGNHGSSLEKHQSCFKATNGPISLVNVITDQVKLKLKDRQISREARQFFNDFVRQMSFHNVEVLRGSPKNLLEQLQKSTSTQPKKQPLPNSARVENKSSKTRRAQSNERLPRNALDRNREDGDRKMRGSGRRHSADRKTEYRPAPTAAYRETRKKSPPMRPPPSQHQQRQRYRNDLEISENASSARQRLGREQQQQLAAPVVVEKKTPTERKEDELRMLRSICRQQESRENLDYVMEKWQKLNLSENGRPDRRRREDADREEVRRLPSEEFDVRRRDENGFRGRLRDDERTDRASAKGERRNLEEKKKKEEDDDDNDVDVESMSSRRRKHRHRKKSSRSASASSSASSGSDYSRKRKHRRHGKHKKKKHRSPSSAPDDSDAGSRRRRGRSHDRRSRRKSREKHRRDASSAPSASSGGEHSAVDHRRGKHRHQREEQSQKQSHHRREKHSRRSKKKYSSSDREAEEHRDRRRARDHRGESAERRRRDKKEREKRYESGSDGVRS